MHVIMDYDVIIIIIIIIIIIEGLVRNELDLLGFEFLH